MQPLGPLLLLTMLAMRLPPAPEEQRPQSDASEAHPAVAVADRSVDPLVIQRAARQFRMQLYHSFRLDRAEYDRRRAAWDRVLAAWTAAGSRADQQHLLLAWLQAAIENASPKPPKPSPAIPAFETVEEPVPLTFDPLPVILTEPAPAVSEQELHLHPSPAVEVHLEQRLWPVGVQRLSVAEEDPRPSIHLPSHAVLAKRGRTAQVAVEATREEPWPSRATTRNERFLPIAPERELPGVEEGELAGVAPREEGKPAAGTFGESASTPVEKASVAPMQALPVAEAPPVGAQPLRPLLPRRGARVEPGWVEPPQPSLASIPQRAPLVPAFDRLPGLDRRELQPPPSVPRSAPSGSPAPATSRALEPRRVAPLPTAAPVASIPPRRPVMPAQSPKEPTRQQTAVIDQTELSARILGGNLALRECEAELDNDKPWDAALLRPLVERLKRVVIQRHDCTLLYDLLPESERSFVGTFESPQPVIRILSKRIVEARQRTKSARFPGTDAQRAAELQGLEELTTTLTELATKWL